MVTCHYDGCEKCGWGSHVVGVFNSREEADKASEDHDRDADHNHYHWSEVAEEEVQ